jgi:hypothetical protein
MIVRLLVTAGLLGAAAPALADEVHRSAARFDPARCTMQQVHTPAGKPVHNAPIVRCRTATTATATVVASAKARPARP